MAAALTYFRHHQPWGERNFPRCVSVGEAASAPQEGRLAPPPDQDARDTIERAAAQPPVAEQPRPCHTLATTTGGKTQPPRLRLGVGEAASPFTIQGVVSRSHSSARCGGRKRGAMPETPHPQRWRLGDLVSGHASPAIDGRGARSPGAQPPAVRRRHRPSSKETRQRSRWGRRTFSHRDSR